MNNLTFIVGMIFLAGIRLSAQKGNMEYGLISSVMISESQKQNAPPASNVSIGLYAARNIMDRLGINVSIEYQTQRLSVNNPLGCSVGDGLIFSILFGGTCNGPSNYTKKTDLVRLPVLMTLDIRQNRERKGKTNLVVGYAYGRMLSANRGVYRSYVIYVPFKKNLHYGIIGIDFRWHIRKVRFGTGMYIEFTEVDKAGIFGDVQNYKWSIHIGW